MLLHVPRAMTVRHSPVPGHVGCVFAVISKRVMTFSGLGLTSAKRAGYSGPTAVS